MIHAPYNFVPLNRRIFFPKWANQISHDIPFSDGNSGIINIIITAETPIFIRNGSKQDKDYEFSYYSDETGKKKYFIPGTSIKGMIRNVFEIISFSKMNFVDDRKFTWRELGIPEYSQKFTVSFNDEPLVNAGFIREMEGRWELYPCDYARIEQSDLDQQINKDQKIGYSNNLLSAVQKYKFWLNNGQNIKNNFEISELKTDVFIKQCGKFRRATFNVDNGIEGQLVFTGQIGPKDSFIEGEHGKRKKHLEFVFYNITEEPISIDDRMKRNFILNHSDDRNKAKHKSSLSPNEEWGYWKVKMDKGKDIPVFWLGSRNDLKSFGLSMLYRLPLKYSVMDLINRSKPDNHKDNRIDLTECVFGYSNSEKSLKGRVQFSHAYCTSENPTILNPDPEVLSSPKPTFYPNYLKNGDYNKNTSQISGRKRYPVHKDITSRNYAENVRLDNVGTQFKPLDKGTEFKGKIKYHNLREVELGALLVALTFYGNENILFHSLGMAKPLGYGKVKLSILSEEKLDLKKLMDLFVYTVEEDIKDLNWKGSEQIKELFTMAHEQKNEPNSRSELSYMELLEHLDAKNNSETLPYYSNIGHGVNELSFQTQKDFQKNLDVNNIDRMYQKYQNNDVFILALECYLLNKEYKNDLLNYYRKFFYNPSIFIKYLKGKDVKGSELKNDLENASKNDFKKSDKAFQEILLYIIRIKYGGQIPERFSNIEQNFMYGWENMNLNSDKVMDIIDNIDQNIWPPINTLKGFIKATELEDKETLIALLDEALGNA